MLIVVLLACGVVAPFVYVAGDVVASFAYPGYSYRDQAVSELFAIGAPTAPLVVPFFTLSSIGALLFGFGAFASANQKSLRTLGVATMGSAIVGLLIWNVFPMHMRGAERTLTDRMHLILASNPFVMIGMIAAAFALPGRFRACTVVTIALMLAPAVFAFRLAPALDANAPTPWLGATERFAQYVELLWQAELACCS